MTSVGKGRQYRAKRRGKSSPHRGSRFSYQSTVLRFWQRWGNWVLGLMVGIAMLVWQWQLLLATGVGVGAMALIYLLQTTDWPVKILRGWQWLSRSHQQLTLAVGGGSLAAVGTYMAASLWVESDRPAMALTMILQGLGTLTTLGLLSWQLLNRTPLASETQFNQWLRDLTDTDDLKRLIAVRQLTHWATTTPVDRSQSQAIQDYFHRLLGRETDPTLRNAILEGLQALEDPESPLANYQPLQIPLTLQRAKQRVEREMAEE